MEQPEWMRLAWQAYGEKEVRGRRDNRSIVKFYSDVGHGGIKHDEVAWCAAFVGSCLERAGQKSTRSLMARSYLKWGEAIDEPRPGAIAVLRRGRDTSLGHVGFVVRATTRTLYLLGGNQSDQVKISGYARSRLLGFRWPVESTQLTNNNPQQDDLADKAADDVFERALIHVLEMEGGYTDDPHDPGGATNFGITIGDFARELNVTLNSGNLAKLKRQLGQISPDVVRGIYWKRYWQRAKCNALPPALAVMHFDCAVNQGVGRAIPFLQSALGVDADGEIGPLTLAAAAQSDLTQTLADYADLRRQHYRGLGHFWRFGRGWLRRVERTLALAQTLIGANEKDAHIAPGDNERSKIMDGNKENTELKTGKDVMEKTKWWGESMTIWGTIITAASTILPVLGPLIGLDITAELIKELGAHVIQLLKLSGGLIGIVMTIYGRARATTRLARREVKLMM